MSRRDPLFGRLVLVTQHAEQRVRERIGVPRRGVARLADRALADGHDVWAPDGRAGRQYGAFIWIFEDEQPGKPFRVLVTVVRARTTDDVRAGLLEREKAIGFRIERRDWVRRREREGRAMRSRIDAGRRAAGGV